MWALLCGTHWLYLSQFSSDPAAARQLPITIPHPVVCGFPMSGFYGPLVYTLHRYSGWPFCQDSEFMTWYYSKALGSEVA